LTDEIRDYGSLFDQDTETVEFKLEAIALRLSHMISEAMDERCINRTELARALDVSAPMVTKILSGRSNFTLKTMVGVADALGYEFDVVLKPKDYCVAVDYVLSDWFNQRGSILGRKAVNATRSTAVQPEASMSMYGELPWSFSVCDTPDSSLDERAAA
jgi:transcriptional regulator with XRE-family HTH domain